MWYFLSVRHFLTFQSLRLYVPPALPIRNSVFCPHSVFTCFAWNSEQTAIIFLYSIKLSVFITDAESVYCAVSTGSSNQTDEFRPYRLNQPCLLKGSLKHETISFPVPFTIRLSESLCLEGHAA